ncbi:MAG: hypothetical protein Kow0062_21580 [Acidobacteriota bacterium]
MRTPRILVTGSSGFIGRHLLDAIKDDWIVYGIARRSQARSGAPVHPNIHWLQVDIGDREALRRAFATIRHDGPLDMVLHLAAHYDFTGEEDPEYWRTNVDGLRNVLDECRVSPPGRFIFSSSVAACRFPPPGGTVDESSPPDGDHVYAVTKRIGEQMLDEYRECFSSVIVRCAAIFSDWCEYPPLYFLLETWLSNSWNRRVLGGRGESAIPYLHIDDAVSFFRTVLDRAGDLPHGEILLCSPDGATSQRELFLATTDYCLGAPLRPILMPKPLCGPGLWFLNLLGRIVGQEVFLKPWMARYIDRKLVVDARRTRERLHWRPRARLAILRRIPFLIDHRMTDPVEWHRRNRAAMHQIRLARHLKIRAMLERHEQEIVDEMSRRLTAPGFRERFPTYQRLERGEMAWNTRIALQTLAHAIQLRQKALFVAYCRELARRRYESGFGAEEVTEALDMLEQVCRDVLVRDPEYVEVADRIEQCLTMTIRIGQDQIEDFYESQLERAHHLGRRRASP